MASSPTDHGRLRVLPGASADPGVGRRRTEQLYGLRQGRRVPEAVALGQANSRRGGRRQGGLLHARRYRNAGVGRSDARGVAQRPVRRWSRDVPRDGRAVHRWAGSSMRGAVVRSHCRPPRGLHSCRQARVPRCPHRPHRTVSGLLSGAVLRDVPAAPGAQPDRRFSSCGRTPAGCVAWPGALRR